MPLVEMLVPHKAARDEYLILLNNQMVGTIHKVYRPVPEPWRWALDSHYGNAVGWSASFEDAKVAFRKAWDERKNEA